MLGWFKGKKSIKDKKKEAVDYSKEDSNSELDPEEKIDDIDQILEKEEVLDLKNFIIQNEDLYKGFWDPTVEEFQVYLKEFE